LKSFFIHVIYNIVSWFRIIMNPENVNYGSGLKRKTALRSVGNGWSKLINNLYDAKPRETQVLQVKEKFSSLHFYVSNGPEWYQDLIDYYEDKSNKICEQCGKPGRIRENRNWILTLCDECDSKDNNCKCIK
jgi:hypothetical protein